jgi:hypothetical protein
MRSPACAGGFSERASGATVRGVRRVALLSALAVALLPAASAAAARPPRVLLERDLPGMKASFTATQPLTTIKRFVAVYSDEHSRKRDRAELRQCGFRGGTATALFQSTESKDTTQPLAVWTSVVQCKSAAQALRFARAERQDVNREWTRKPTAAKVRRQSASALPRGALAAVAATELTGGAKASLTIVLVPRGQRVAVLTLTSQTGFDPYPQARNLMRRMLGMKPLAIAKPKPRTVAPLPLGVPVEAARFVRR